MNVINTRILLLGLMLVNVWLSSHAIDYYDAKYKYEWTDYDGVKHTSHITEEATSTEQIIELLKYIYTNTEIPGTKISEDVTTQQGWWESTRTVTTKYNDAVVPYGIAEDDNRYENTAEGMTMLVVKVRDDWDATAFNKVTNYGSFFSSDYQVDPTFKHRNDKYVAGDSQDAKNANVSSVYVIINESIESVKLVTSSIEVAGDNSGDIFYLPGNYNRFFFITKGKTHEGADTGQLTVDINWQLGTSWGVANNGNTSAPFCGMYEEYSPTQEKDNGYMLTINDSNIPAIFGDLSRGDKKYVGHDCMSVVQKNHFISMSGGTNTSKYDANMCVFVPDKRWTAWTGRHESSWLGVTVNYDFVYYNESYQPVFLFYTVALSETHEIDMTEKKCQINLTWESSFDNLSSEGVSEVYDVYRVDAYGMVSAEPINSTPLTERNFTVYEDVTELGKTVSYVVSARPLSATQEWAKSNVVTIVINGYDPAEKIKMSIVGSYVSAFNYADGLKNRYQNSLVIENNVANQAGGIKVSHLTVGTKIGLHRSIAGASEDEAVTQIEIVSVDKTGADTWYYNYQYTIGGSTQTGQFTSVASDDADVNFGDGGLKLTDVFEVSTEENIHPSGYSYQAHYYPTAENSDLEAYSNIVDVPVYKADYKVQPISYNEDVLTESVTQLNPVSSKNTVTFNVVSNNANMQQYAVYREGRAEPVAYAQHLTTGGYKVFELAEDGSMQETIIVGEGVSEITISDNLYDHEASADDMSVGYYIGISAYNSENNTNTYGSMELGAPLVKTMFDDNPELTYNTVTNSSTEYNYRTYKDWSVVIDESLLEVAEISRFQLWRSVDGKDYTPVDLTKANQTESYDLLEITGRDGANNIIHVMHADAFTDRAYSDENPLEVKYLLRVYARIKDATTTSITPMATSEDEFMIAEATPLVVTYSGNITTEIEDLAANETKLKVYPNPADTEITVVGEGNISIYSLSGVKVLDITDGETSRTVDVSALAAGMYVVRAGDEVVTMIKR